MNRYFRAKVVSTTPLDNKNNLLTIKPLEKVINPVPGQFYMIEAGNSHDPLLKRPFSYFRKTSEGIHFLYTVRGKGTSLMKKFIPWQIINLIGPLGNGYPKPGRGYTPIFVAGGTGIASIYSLVEKLSGKACVFYGAKCREELLVMDELKKLGTRSFICTDDGSFGEKGTTVDVLKQFLALYSSPQGSDRTPHVIYACGPKPMLEAIARIAVPQGIRGYVSLEENMACGFGACLGCAVETVHGYKRVCREGPVFPMEEIVW